MPTFRTTTATLLLALLLVCGPAAVFAQARPGTPTPTLEQMVVHVYTLKHKPASEASALVYRLLSQRGSVELQPGGNTLAIRDSPAVVDRILQRLREFDSPGRPMRFEILIVKASRTPVSPPIQHSDLPEGLTKRLRGFLAYDIFELQAKAYLPALEGQAVAYSLSNDYDVTFRLGTLSAEGKIPVNDFLVSRRKAGNGGQRARPSRDYDMDIPLGQPHILVLARDEESPEALMVVLTPRRGAEIRRPGARP